MKTKHRTEESLSEQYSGTIRVGEHHVVEETEIVPGQHPEPHLRYEGQTSYLERYFRCVACDLNVLRIRDFPATCDPPRFAPGDVVIDEQNPDSEAIVIYPDCGPANVVKIDDDQTVAEYPGNEVYSADDTVVRICFIDWLDAYVPGWQEWAPQELGSALRQYSEQYSVELRLYSYPESRLLFPDQEAEAQARDRQPVAVGGSR